MDNEQRIAFSKQWAAFKNFDKAVDKHIRALENEIAELRGQTQCLSKRNAKLTTAIEKTLQENMHLADGDNCTLSILKNVLAEV
jgi:hypothetical protein